jgi:hypothetical protein
VNPAISANSTVTMRRSSRPGTAVSDIPQLLQKRAPPGLSAAQLGQVIIAP